MTFDIVPRISQPILINQDVLIEVSDLQLIVILQSDLVTVVDIGNEKFIKYILYFSVGVSLFNFFFKKCNAPMRCPTTTVSVQLSSESKTLHSAEEADEAAADAVGNHEKLVRP